MHFNPAWLALIVPIVFPLWWCCVLFLIAALSGWRSIAARYPALDLPSGKLQSFRLAYIGWAKYQGCVKMNLSERGLYLRTIFIFRPFHPPLLIPWRAIRGEAVKRMFGSGGRLTIEDVSTKIEVQDSIYAQLQPYLKQH